MNFSDKVVLVTGGSQGIGRALAERFVSEGSSVIIISKNQKRVETTASEIGATALVADVRDESALQHIAESTVAKFGRIDIWVNSAGVFRKFPKDQLIDMERAHELFEVNFFGAVFGSRTALRYMKSGAIININSSFAIDVTLAVGAELYVASKWALRGYIEVLRNDNSNKGIELFSVYPSGTKSHLRDEDIPAGFNNFMEPSYVADKIVDNLKKDKPEQDLTVKRPVV